MFKNYTRTVEARKKEKKEKEEERKISRIEHKKRKRLRLLEDHQLVSMFGRDHWLVPRQRKSLRGVGFGHCEKKKKKEKKRG